MKSKNLKTPPPSNTNQDFSDELARSTIAWKYAFDKKRLISAFTAFIFACIAFFLAYTHLYREVQNLEMKTVLVTQSPLHSGDIVHRKDLQLLNIPTYAIPLNALTQYSQIEGKKILHPIAQNSIITQTLIAETKHEKSLSDTLSSEERIITLSEKWFDSPFPPLFKNDRIAIFASLNDGNIENTQAIIENAEVLSTTSPKSGNKKLTLKLTDNQLKQILHTYSNKATLVLSLTP